MKGRKFSAAEKHFKEKEVKLRQEISWYRDSLQQYQNKYVVCNEELTVCQKELTELKERYHKLLDCSKLSEDDIITALKKDKNVAELSGMLGAMYDCL